MSNALNRAACGSVPTANDKVIVNRWKSGVP
jgi:hypothetical protein